jgi:hypothetical protein
MNPTDIENALRAECQRMREENAELRQQIAQRDHWIKDLRETVAALLRPAPSENFTHNQPNVGTLTAR